MEKRVTQVMEQFQKVLQEEVPVRALETGAVKRVRRNGLDVVTLVSSVIFGFWQDPQWRLSGLAQVAERREVSVTTSAICQRFTPETAELFEQVLARFTQVHLESEAVQTPLLKQVSAVIVEDSSTISLPDELATMWQGCGGSEGSSAAALKLFVRWNVLSGQVWGPLLTDARTNDHHSPFQQQELPAGALYLADLGFFGIGHLLKMARGRTGKRYFVSRLQAKTNLYTCSGHLLDLHGLLPQQVGEVRDLGAVLGHRDGLPIRLILVKVPQDVVDQRRVRLTRTARKHGREPSEESLYLAQWTIVITNLSRKQADFGEVLVLLRLRWQIERLFRLWKEDGKIDEWRSHNPYRILAELYGKLCAMILQHALIQEGCWLDPLRSISLAAASLRREANRLMVAFYEGDLHRVVPSLLRSLRSGCQIDRRAAFPSTAQLLEQGLDWQLQLLLT
jgi:hypothetical protein